ncbi:lipocalin family protein [Sphingobacterium sp. SRCM116780]|uniref:lipocalin family protein n=1 Tax=Sphingobacterium sp. SRCM116780 TaxID=2907623 RepID=UPI001F2DF652|nr:lipocalin family protein [Sphingobacterium sp. SRCM116780]UIR56874.1 lipocalin family protein [Sphingobacterium sp. SRCM116780]
MQNLLSFLFIAYTTLSSSICFGQSTSILANENGLVLQYKKLDKIGSRYDEYCKTTFDIYQVEGTVINNNSDKAAMVTAILSFEGQACNKIYSNDAPAGGEVINKMFNLDIAHLTKHQTQYWVNRYVHLLPNDSMIARGYVEVKQGEQVPDPDKYFTYELIPSQNTSSTVNVEGKTSANQPVKPDNNTSKYNSLILGEWYFNSLTYEDENGKEVVETDNSGKYVIKSDGTAIQIAYDKKYNIRWEISENEIHFIYEDGLKIIREILQLDNKRMVLQGASESVMGFMKFTYTKK